MQDTKINREILIGSRLKQIRELVSLSQERFANSIDIPASRYIAYENDRSKPPIEFYNVLKDIYGINVHWLITGEGEMYVSGNPPLVPPLGKGGEGDHIVEVSKMVKNSQHDYGNASVAKIKQMNGGGGEDHVIGANEMMGNSQQIKQIKQMGSRIEYDDEMYPGLRDLIEDEEAIDTYGITEEEIEYLKRVRFSGVSSDRKFFIEVLKTKRRQEREGKS